MMTNARSAKRRYLGTLAQRIPPYPKTFPSVLSGETSADWLRDAGKWVAQRQLEKLPSLFEHYGLDPKASEAAWQLLVLHLAQEHVPGFQLASKRGAPRRTGGMPEFVPEVERMVYSGGLTVLSACKNVAKRRGRSAESIRRGYTRYQRLLRDVFVSIKTTEEVRLVLENLLADARSSNEWDMHFIGREMLRAASRASKTS